MNAASIMEPKKINILGTVYTIWTRDESEDIHLRKNDGYCDKSTKEIVILRITKDNCQLGNPDWYRKKVMRHEIIHAFLFESGLHENINNIYESDHDEQMIDWYAIQTPKILQAFKEADCL